MLWPTHAPLSDSFIVTDETIRGSKYSCRRQFYELGEGRVNDVSPGFLNRNHLLDCISSPVESLRTHTHTHTPPPPGLSATRKETQSFDSPRSSDQCNRSTDDNDPPPFDISRTFDWNSTLAQFDRPALAASTYARFTLGKIIVIIRDSLSPPSRPIETLPITPSALPSAFPFPFLIPQKPPRILLLLFLFFFLHESSTGRQRSTKECRPRVAVAQLRTVARDGPLKGIGRFRTRMTISSADSCRCHRVNALPASSPKVNS